MIASGLDLEQAPPISVPLRFFLTAPVFALLAAAVVLWQGPDALESRWTPAALAATHLLTLGFMTMVMIGAMMQMLPVLAGAPVPWPKRVADVIHGGLALGTLALAGGLLLGDVLWLKISEALLAVAFATFLAALIVSLGRAPVANVTVRMMRLAGFSVTVTAALGLWLLASRGWGAALPGPGMRDLHPGWGFLGWTGLLAIGIAYQVVPMFQLTPPYPAWMPRWLGRAIAAMLIVWSAVVWAGEGALAAASAGALALLFAWFALTTLALQRRARRRTPDVTLLFWRTGMLSTVLAVLLWVAGPVIGEASARAAVTVGLFAVVGAAMSIITGMLYKIAPFLAWFHLQAKTGMGRRVPNMKQYLGDAPQRRQFWMHVASLALLAAALVWPRALAYPAALVFGISALQLGWNLAAVMRTYRRELRSLKAAAR